jgi:hypothetical protein
MNSEGGVVRKNFVVLAIEYECTVVTCNVIVARQYNLPSRLVEFIIPTGRVVRTFIQIAPNATLLELHSHCHRNKLISRRRIEVPAMSSRTAIL